MPFLTRSSLLALPILLASAILRADDAPASTPIAPTPPAAPIPAPASTPEIDLQRKLDEPFNLTLQKVELSEAFKQIAGTAQISLQVDPACYDALPYGATTRVSADFRQAKLKDAIEEVLVPLSLQQTVSGATVIIRPTAPLARIGRRADWDELKLLQELRTSDLKPVPPGAPFEWTAALRAALDNRPNLVVAIGGASSNPSDPAAAIPGGTGPVHDKAIDQLKKQLPISAFRALQLYCQLTNQIWFVEASPATGSGPGISPGSGTVHIMSHRRWLERQLERPIQLAFTNAPLEQVVAELSHASGIRFTPEPGLYQSAPLIILNSNNGSVLQTLEALSGGTRIAFDIRDDSIFLHLGAGGSGGSSNSPATAPATNTATRTDPIVARIAVPVGPNGLTMDVLIHESDLPPELNDTRKKKIRETLEALQIAWSPETRPAPTSTSQPATQPEPK